MIIRAWGVVDENFSIIQDGAVAVRHGLIVSVGRFKEVKQEDGGPVYEFGDSLILPGLVNAHTHLELTALAGKVAPRGGFVGWLRTLMGELKGWKREDFIASCKEGLRQSASSGTTLVGDITRPTLPLEHYYKDPLRKVVYLELMGFGQFFSAALVLGVRLRLSRLKQNEIATFGLSPHAPYSAAPELYIRVCNGKDNTIPICTHIAESEEEIIFLRTGKGPMRKLLAEVGVDLTSFKVPGLRPVEYLHSLGVMSDNLTLIHANYLTDKEIGLIADSGASVVYCPRSHAYFGHKEHPYKKLIQAGVNVALGTDSLASNTSLSILDEMRFLVEKGERPEDVLRMATINGAKALRRERVGLLKAGWHADIALFPIRGRGEVLEGILGEGTSCIMSMVGGRTVCDIYGIMEG